MRELIIIGQVPIRCCCCSSFCQPPTSAYSSQVVEPGIAVPQVLILASASKSFLLLLMFIDEIRGAPNPSPDRTEGANDPVGVTRAPNQGWA